MLTIRRIRRTNVIVRPGHCRLSRLPRVARRAERLQVLHLVRTAARHRHNVVHFELNARLPADAAAIEIALENLVACPDGERSPLARSFRRTRLPPPLRQFIGREQRFVPCAEPRRDGGGSNRKPVLPDVESMRAPPLLPKRSVPELEHHIEQLLIAPVSNRARHQPRRLIRRPHTPEPLDDSPGTDASLSLDISRRHRRPPGHHGNPPQFRNQAGRVISPQKVDFVRHSSPREAYARGPNQNGIREAMAKKTKQIFFVNRQYSN